MRKGVKGKEEKGIIREERRRDVVKMERKKHCEKRFAIFPSPAGMSLIKLSLVGNN
jgi:hypothetical protein